MGKMKEIYMELWEQTGGDIPPDYTLQDYLAKEKAEHELELRKEQEAVEANQGKENQQDDDSVYDSSGSNPEA